MTQSEHVLPPKLEEVRQRAYQSGIFQLLGTQIDRMQDGTGAVHLQVDARLYHAQQIVHGGVIFTLADTAMSMALMSLLPSETPFSTIEAKINYLRPVRTGELSAEAVIVHQGRSTAVLECTVFNVNGDERTPIARVLGTFNIQRPKTA